jgi:hypothetical protein
VRINGEAVDFLSRAGSGAAAWRCGDDRTHSRLRRDAFALRARIVVAAQVLESQVLE